jgi:prepilin-type N-terminal cleavage/methylation domain-containing protein
MRDHRLISTIARRLRRDDGYSLIELLTTMAMLGIVLAALTVVFTSGLRAQVNANQTLESQQNARLAVERLRRDVHCASAVTGITPGIPGTSITLALPDACPSPATSLTYTTQLVSANRYQLTRAGVPVADYLVDDDVFTYFEPTTTELGRLHLDLPVNRRPGTSHTSWRLIDDIVLRNTTRT